MSITERIAKEAKTLPPEKQREVLDFLEFLKSRKPAKRRLRDPLGMWKGIDISSEDIAEARREMWGNFPRDL